jgi:hypothetical protein
LYGNACYLSWTVTKVTFLTTEQAFNLGLVDGRFFSGLIRKKLDYVEAVTFRRGPKRIDDNVTQKKQQKGVK